MLGLSIFFGVVALCAMLFVRIGVPTFDKLKNGIAVTVFVLSILGGASTSVGYNQSGFCTHIKTILNTESSKCDIGWYFAGWGTPTVWPHYVTISHSIEESPYGADTFRGTYEPPYRIRMSDNWAGDVTQTTRFGIPQNNEQFLKMARDFRSPEHLITSTLKPAITSSLDSVANLFTMEEYYAGGLRDEFKDEFERALVDGRAAVTRQEVIVDGPEIDRDVAPSDSDVVLDTAETGGSERVRIITEKLLDSNGQEIRNPHAYADYGIIVSSAIVQNVDPDDAYEEQIKARKDAAARRIVAREQRLEQEEQRLLAIASGERDIAQRQAEARVIQIEATTNAETEKRLALIAAERLEEEASINLRTAEINRNTAEVNAEARQIAADAEAYEREVILQADGALAQKLDAYIQAQRVWADAFSKRNVPQFMFGGAEGESGPNSDVTNFMTLLTMNAARDLALDMSIPAQTGTGSQ